MMRVIVSRLPALRRFARSGPLETPLRSLRTVRHNMLGRGHNGLNDLVVTRAAAEIAGERFSDALRCRRGLAIEQGLGRDKNARRAIAALRRAAIRELLLQGMQLTVLDEALHGRHRASGALGGEREAGKHGLAVEEHRACAALTQFAAVFGARKVQVFPQDFQQSLVIVDQRFRRLTIDCQQQTNLHRRALWPTAGC